MTTDKNSIRLRRLLWLQFLPLAVLLSAAPPACARPRTSSARTNLLRKPMDTSNRLALFDLIADLGKSRPFRSASLSERLGLFFKEDLAASNPYFHLYRTHGQVHGTRPPPAGGAIVSAELRESTEALKADSVNGLLILEINDKLCVSQDEVSRQFGQNPELELPSPHAPPSEPIYWAYRKDGYKLSFGFSRNEPSCLVSVVLDVLPSR